MIMPPECAALDLIRLGDVDASSAPRLTLADYRVGRNRPLNGAVANLGGRRLYLMRVDNEGKAYRIDATTQPGGNSATFSLPLPRGAGPVGPVQLVLAMTSDKPIAALDTFRSGDLKALAPRSSNRRRPRPRPSAPTSSCSSTERGRGAAFSSE